MLAATTTKNPVGARHRDGVGGGPGCHGCACQSFAIFLETVAGQRRHRPSRRRVDVRWICDFSRLVGRQPRCALAPAGLVTAPRPEPEPHPTQPPRPETPPAVISRKMPTVGLPTLLGHASSPHMSTERLCPLSSGRWLPPRVRTWWHAQVRSLSLHHVAPGRSPASQTEVASASCDRTARASAAPCTLCARPRAHAMPHVMPCFTRAGGLCAVAIRCPCCSCVSRRSMLEAGRAPAALCARARAAASATARASTGRARASQGTRVPRALPPRRAPYRATTAACARPAAPAAVDGTLPLSLYLDIELLSPSFSPRPSRPRTATPARDTWRGLGDRARDMQISLISRRPPTATPPRGPWRVAAARGTPPGSLRPVGAWSPLIWSSLLATKSTL
jgi:hypothetical protein